MNPIERLRRALGAELERAIRPTITRIGDRLENVITFQAAAILAAYKPETKRRGSVLLLGRVLDSNADLEVLAIVPVEVERGEYLDAHVSGYRPMRLASVLAFGDIGIGDLVVGDRQVAPAPARVQAWPPNAAPITSPGSSPILFCNEAVHVQVNVRVRVWGK